MEFIELSNGNKIPSIGLGTDSVLFVRKLHTGNNNFSTRAWSFYYRRIMRNIWNWELSNSICNAFRMGYRMIDTSAAYNNEEAIGRAIRKSGVRREELFIQTRITNKQQYNHEVRESFFASLKKLGLEYVDMYMIHWPVAQKKGVPMPHRAEDMVSLKDMPLDLTWAEIEKAQQQGLIRTAGVSNFGAKRLGELIEKAEITPAVNQVESHPLLQQNDLIEFCRKNMIAVTAYSPLGSQHDGDETDLFRNEIIMEIAGRLNCTSAQVLLAWQLARGVSVIPKTVHEMRLKENFAASAVELDDEDMKKIASLDRGQRFIDGSSFAFGDYTADSIFA